MSDSTVILNAHLPSSLYEGRKATTLYQIELEAAIVRAITPMEDVQEPGVNKVVIDVAGDWISQGAVDLQINGALGLAFPDLRPARFEQLQAICDLLWQQGVDGFCPTIVTTSLENFHGSLAAIRDFQSQQQKNNAATIIGAHLEGPFLDSTKRGAHPAEFLQPLTLDAVKTVVDDFADVISIVTLAPELGEDSGVIEWLCDRNITVSMGHSLATAQQANKAFSQGATMVTHAFNAMPGLHHRDPGLLGAALTDDRVSCGFIADGQHICPTMLDLLLRSGRGTAKKVMNGLFLVSDALSPLGLPDGKYPWDSREIEVINGTARLADGTLSGTTLPLIEGAQNLVKWGLCDVEEAIALVTQAPRQAVELPGFVVGSPAQLLRWEDKEDQLNWARLAV